MLRTEKLCMTPSLCSLLEQTGALKLFLVRKVKKEMFSAKEACELYSYKKANCNLDY